MAALGRFYRNVTWKGIIHEGGMSPATPAMTGIGCSTVHAIQDRSVKHLPGQDRHPRTALMPLCQADDGGPSGVGHSRDRPLWRRRA